MLYPEPNGRNRQWDGQIPIVASNMDPLTFSDVPITSNHTHFTRPHHVEFGGGERRVKKGCIRHCRVYAYRVIIGCSSKFSECRRGRHHPKCGGWCKSFAKVIAASVILYILITLTLVVMRNKHQEKDPHALEWTASFKPYSQEDLVGGERVLETSRLIDQYLTDTERDATKQPMQTRCASAADIGMNWRHFAIKWGADETGTRQNITHFINPLLVDSVRGDVVQVKDVATYCHTHMISTDSPDPDSIEDHTHHLDKKAPPSLIRSEESRLGQYLEKIYATHLWTQKMLGADTAQNDASPQTHTHQHPSVNSDGRHSRIVDRHTWIMVSFINAETLEREEMLLEETAAFCAQMFNDIQFGNWTCLG
jgi:hypothetical protein